MQDRELEQNADRLAEQLRVPAGPEVIAEVFDGEAVVVNLGTGIYYSLDRAATKLWEAMCAARAYSELDSDQRAFIGYLVAEQLAACPAIPGATASGRDDWPGISRFSDMADLLLLDPIHDIDIDGSGWPIVDAEKLAS